MCSIAAVLPSRAYIYIRAYTDFTLCSKQLCIRSQRDTDNTSLGAAAGRRAAHASLSRLPVLAGVGLDPSCCPEKHLALEQPGRFQPPSADDCGASEGYECGRPPERLEDAGFQAGNPDS